jgi:hypothetical protein
MKVNYDRVQSFSATSAVAIVPTKAGCDLHKNSQKMLCIILIEELGSVSARLLSTKDNHASSVLSGEDKTSGAA